jgi:large subunit ribosomal protein L22
MAAAADRQTVRAQARWVRTSARKARVVAAHIRGRSVPEARTVLAFTQRAAARDLEKVLASAVANAEANHGLRGDDLVVARAVVDEGPTLKRWRARARGRVARIRKRTCHITIELQAPAPSAAPSRAQAPADEAAASPAKPPVADPAPPEQEQAKTTRRRARKEAAAKPEASAEE